MPLLNIFFKKSQRQQQQKAKRCNLVTKVDLLLEESTKYSNMLAINATVVGKKTKSKSLCVTFKVESKFWKI